jgi:hypothetical protein
MLAADYIHPRIPSLQVTDPAGTALRLMEDLGVDTLPVSDEAIFMGFVVDENLLEQDQLDTPLAQVELESRSCWVYADAHLYDLLRVTEEQQSKWIAVVDRDHHLVGVASTQEALSAYANSLSIHSQGSVLVISLQMKDYQLSEIARLVESENTKILSCLLSSDPMDPQQVDVTLKLDRQDLRHVKATLQRFGYQVMDFAQEEGIQSIEEERIGNLLRFLES